MGIEFVCGRFIKLLVAGVVYKESIVGGRTANSNAIHRVGLVLGHDDLAILLVVEVAYGKERDPHVTVGLGAVNEHEGKCKFTFELAYKYVHRLHSVLDRIEPEVVRHLFFGEVGMGHVDHTFLMTFNKTI